MSAAVPGGPIVLAAGGTGGHLFPAEAVARQLQGRGCAVHLLTDRRADAFAVRVPGLDIRVVRAGRLGGGPLRTACGLAGLALGIVEARRLLRRLRPRAVIGFGGYPSVPTMLAAAHLGLPTLIHEQNAVLGRANRLLAPRVGRIATGFPETAMLRPGRAGRVVHTGNPVRPAILAVGERDYAPPAADRPIELLVLGGSQGARVLGEVVPAAVAALPASCRARLRVSQQARPEQQQEAAARYRDSGVAAEIAGFFDDMPARLARAQLVICRAGASTIAELAAAGRPSLLVPYPHAADDHQSANAAALAAVGGGWVVPQQALSATLLATRLDELLAAPLTLARAAAQARGFGHRDAAERLAALVLDLGDAAGADPRERAA